MAIKGVNNASPVVSLSKGCTHVDLPTALDYTLADAESNGEFNVVNISANSTSYAHGTTATRYMRRASSRNLVVQAAGNFRDNACLYAYSPDGSAATSKDGIMVVGAVDTTGAAVNLFDYSQIPGGTTNNTEGSDSGACVDVWAPGQLIWIAWDDNSHTDAERWSGTSFAAPHVAAMASRYGSSSTNPVLREAYIRGQLFSTGSTDPTTSAAIMVPSYTQSPLYLMPSKLTPYSVSASSTYSTYVASNAFDGNYTSTTWNAGVQPNYPSVQPYIEMDLGYTATLYALRFTPAQSPSGTSTHDVYVGTTYPPTTLAGTVTEDLMDGETMSVDVGGYLARYVRLVTRSSPSWASYYEVEVFGY